MKRGVMLVGVLLALAAKVVFAQAPATLVQDTVYRADGQPAGGTLVVSWGGFTAADGTAITAGTTTVTLGSGGALSLSLAPNAGATPMGSYYTAVFHLNDGTTSREFWVVPVTVPGGGAAKLGGIRNQVLPTSVAMQTVTKAYVDTTVAKAVAGIAPVSSPFVLRAGDTLTGPLVLPADPVNANQAADKHYVDQSVAAATSGTIAASRLPVFGPSGTGHAAGAVPDPGSTAGSSRYLREDGTWSAPSGSGGTSGTAGGDLSGSYPNPTVSTIHATAGTLDGVCVGCTTPAAMYASRVAVGTTSPGSSLFQLGPSGANGTVAWSGSSGTNPESEWFGIYGVGHDLYYGISTSLPSPSGTSTIGGYYSGLGIGGASNGTSTPIFGVLNSTQSGSGLGNTAFTVLDNNAVYTFNNTLDDGSGGAALKSLSTGSSGQFHVDSSGNASATTYTGPTSAPSGSCATNGVWVLSKDGHATFCSDGTWVVKI